MLLLTNRYTALTAYAPKYIQTVCDCQCRCCLAEAWFGTVRQGPDVKQPGQDSPFKRSYKLTEDDMLHLLQVVGIQGAANVLQTDLPACGPSLLQLTDTVLLPFDSSGFSIAVNATGNSTSGPAAAAAG